MKKRAPRVTAASLKRDAEFASWLLAATTGSGPPDLSAAEARRLGEEIASGRALSREIRALAAAYLFRLSERPKAFNLLVDKHPRRSPGMEIAMDYLLQKEILGGSEAALADVGKAWSVAPKTVKNSVTAWRSTTVGKLIDTIRATDRSEGKCLELMRDLSRYLRETTRRSLKSRKKIGT